MGRKYPIRTRLWGLEERRELSKSPSGVLAGAPAENVLLGGYLCRSPLLTAGDSKFFTFSS